MTPAKACCCGHMVWQHFGPNGEGACRVCGRSCQSFHNPGEGHGYVFEITVALVFAILMVSVVAIVKYARRPKTTVASVEIFELFKQEN